MFVYFIYDFIFFSVCYLTVFSTVYMNAMRSDKIIVGIHIGDNTNHQLHDINPVSLSPTRMIVRIPRKSIVPKIFLTIVCNSVQCY